MAEQLLIFEPLFKDEELREEFNDFWYKYDLMPLFTNEHRSTPITVTYVDARSVINTSGSYHKSLLEMSDLLTVGDDNKMYEEALFRVIYNARSFQSLMQNIRQILIYARTEIDQNHEFNTWNIVWYNKELS